MDDLFTHFLSKALDRLPGRWWKPFSLVGGFLVFILFLNLDQSVITGAAVGLTIGFLVGVVLDIIQIGNIRRRDSLAAERYTVSTPASTGHIEPVVGEIVPEDDNSRSSIQDASNPDGHNRDEIVKKWMS